MLFYCTVLTFCRVQVRQCPHKPYRGQHTPGIVVVMWYVVLNQLCGRHVGIQHYHTAPGTVIRKVNSTVCGKNVQVGILYNAVTLHGNNSRLIIIVARTINCT